MPLGFTHVVAAGIFVPKIDDALREIRKYQRDTDLLAKVAPFRRLVKDVAHEVSDCGDFTDKHGNAVMIRLPPTTTKMLQHSAEAYLISVMEEGNLCCIHGKRQTVAPKDVQLARRIRHEVA